MVVAKQRVRVCGDRVDSTISVNGHRKPPLPGSSLQLYAGDGDVVTGILVNAGQRFVIHSIDMLSVGDEHVVRIFYVEPAPVATRGLMAAAWLLCALAGWAALGLSVVAWGRLSGDPVWERLSLADSVVAPSAD